MGYHASRNLRAGRRSKCVQDGSVLSGHVLRNLRSHLKAQKTLNARVHAQAREKDEINTVVNLAPQRRCNLCPYQVADQAISVRDRESIVPNGSDESRSDVTEDIE